MNSSLDLNLLLLARQGGSDVTGLPDLYAVTAPRRTARGRETDSIIIYMSMAGNSPLTTEAHTVLLEKLAHKFYQTTGSLTAAMRTAVEELNLYLLERNLRSTSMGRQGIGQLTMLALRADTLYMAQSGAVHAYLLTPKGAQHLSDPESSGRGLGLSRTATMRFLQIKMDPDDFLVLATQLPSSWGNIALTHPGQQGIEAVRRQLLDKSSQDFSAVIIQAQAGTGKLNLLRRKADAAAVLTSGAAPQTLEDRKLGLPTAASRPPAWDDSGGIPWSVSSATGTTPQPSQDRKLGIPTMTTPGTTTGSGIAEVRYQPAPAASQVPVDFEPGIPQLGFEGEGNGQPPDAATQSGPAAKKRSSPGPWSKYASSVGKALAGAGKATTHALGSAMGTLGSALLRLLKNLLPDADVLRLPPSMMVFIALAIPLVLATVGGLVFLQRGRNQQHQIYYQKAVEDANYATTLTNPLEQRMAWLTVLGDLNKAEDYTVTSQSQELRTTATANLDQLDVVKRLDYKQAIVGGLDSTIKVTRIVATATELYLLNSAQGSVIRAIMTGRGYEIDPNFQCGPTYGPINVGPIIDIAELPPGAFENATLLGMDKDGNLLYCVAGSQPYSASMAPPNTGFGAPGAMTLDRNDLFVLDQKVNAVWIYRDLEVRQQPRLFFGEYVPKMEDVIDLAEYNDDLYLLHSDGKMTKCTYSGLAESPTRCDDPYSYSDNRPGRVHGPVIEDAVFSQIYFASLPERSIYMLDPQDQSIYYFSVLLNLQWQYQPVKPLTDGNATAFAISPNQTAFLAIGNYVYYAAMP